jgi:REP element-mobilizing transposase RayT
MAQSLARILVHLIFSTKDRAAVLAPGVRPELRAYIRSQEEHHRRVAFQDEFRDFLRR